QWVNANSQFEYTNFPSGGSTTFLELTDTPDVYAGQGGKLVRVNVAANALEFYSLIAADVPNIGENQVTNLTTDLAAKADKVGSATNGNFAGLNASGNLIDSAHKHSDYALAIHTHTASQVTDFPAAADARITAQKG